MNFYFNLIGSVVIAPLFTLLPAYTAIASTLVDVLQPELQSPLPTTVESHNLKVISSESTALPCLNENHASTAQGLPSDLNISTKQIAELSGFDNSLS
jgi:hypothetical protein